MTSTSLDPQMIEAIRSADGLSRFFRASVVQDEGTGSLSYLDPSSTQTPVIEAIRHHQRVVVCKPRQCHASTVCIMEALRRTEYWPGHHGAILTNLADTSSTLFDRILTAYRHQDPSIQVPSSRKGRAGIAFAHGGTLKVLTARSDDAGVGNSLDFLHGSELGSWPDAGGTLSKIMPALLKRPHSRVVLESTPGESDGAWHEIWSSALAGKNGFHPVFIRWWEHPSYTRPHEAIDIVPTDEEDELLRLYPGMTRGHLAFRRHVLYGVCGGDLRLFARQYPMDEMDGWTGNAVPALEEAPIRALLSDAVATEGCWEQPQQGHQYMLVADPASFGQAGDPSAWSLWDLTTRTEVGAWSARIDPLVLADQLARIGRQYNTALLVIESNAAACIAACIKGGYPRVWQDSTDPQARPGWWATKVRVERSIGALARALSSGAMRVRSRRGLLQLLEYDGDREKRTSGHHFDRVVTYRIAADMLEVLRVPPAKTAATYRDDDGRVRLAMLKPPRPQAPVI